MLLDIFALVSCMCLSLKPKVSHLESIFGYSKAVSSYPEDFLQDQIFLLIRLSPGFRGLGGNAGEVKTWHQDLLDRERCGTLGEKWGYFHECL